MAGQRIAGLAGRENEAGVAEVTQIVDAAETGAVHGREGMVGIGEAAGAPVDGVAAAVDLDGSAGEGAEQGNAPPEGMLEAGLMHVPPAPRLRVATERPRQCLHRRVESRIQA